MNVTHSGPGCVRCGYAPRTSIEEPPASVQNLVNSNEPPPHPTTADLKQRLDDAERFILDTKEEIAWLRSHIDTLSKKRDEAVEHAAAYRKVLHPIRRLPAEILLEIFSWLTDPIDVKLLIDHPVNDTFDMETAPWVLTRVSHPWREVILASPTLWTTVSIDFRKLNVGRTSHLREANLASLLSHYLRMSRDLPLTIAVSSSMGPHPLLSILFSHSSRWDAAYLSLNADAFRMLSSTVKGCVPLLRSLALFGPNVWESLIVDAFQYAPKLRFLQEFFFSNTTRRLLLPWGQLHEYITRFGERDASPDLNAFRQALALQNLTLIAMNSTLEALPMVQNKRILNFKLAARTLQSMAQVLDILSFPVLTKFTIQLVSDAVTGTDSGIHNGCSLLQFLKRSPCLHHFHVYDWRNMSKDLILDLLTAIPTVTDLRIGSITNDVLRALACIENTTPVLLPLLKNLHFTDKGEQLVDESLLLQMIESRFDTNGTCLEAVTLSAAFSLKSPEAQVRLAELRSRGRSVTFLE